VAGGQSKSGKAGPLALLTGRRRACAGSLPFDTCARMAFKCLACPDATGQDPRGLSCQIQSLLLGARAQLGGPPCAAADVAEGRFVEVYTPVLGR
jgi:hypothetical protein